MQHDSTNTEVQFVLRYTKGGGSSTDCLINHMKSKHKIYVIHEGEDHKTIPAQEEIRPQIVKKEASLFEAAKKRLQNNLEKLFHAFNYNQAQINGTKEDFFSHGTTCRKTQK